MIDVDFTMDAYPEWMDEMETALREEEVYIRQERVELRRMAQAPILPPQGLRMGKAIFPRARANLPYGVRNRYGKDEV